jgi:hypothetical protein
MMMKLLTGVVVLCVIGCKSPAPSTASEPKTPAPIQAPPPSPARQYYNELKAADGLDKKANEYVCFRDDPESDAFFIFGEGRYVSDFYEFSGKPLPKKEKEMMDKTLIIRHYKKGVATYSGNEYLTKEDEEYVSEPGMVSGRLLRVRFILNWQTLRYKRDVEYKPKGASGWTPVEGTDTIYGKCELNK